MIRVIWKDGREEALPEEYAVRLYAQGRVKIQPETAEEKPSAPTETEELTEAAATERAEAAEENAREDAPEAETEGANESGAEEAARKRGKKKR